MILLKNGVRRKTSTSYPALPSKKFSSDLPIWDLALYVIIRGHVTSPFSALPAQRICPANETISYSRAATHVCVCEYTHFKLNFGFDSLKSRLNCDMEEKGIVGRDCLSPEPCSGQWGSGGRQSRPTIRQFRATIADNNPFLLH